MTHDNIAVEQRDIKTRNEIVHESISKKYKRNLGVFWYIKYGLTPFFVQMSIENTLKAYTTSVIAQMQYHCFINK